MPESVVDALGSAARRDAAKGGTGFRKTREVAEYCAISLASARRRLWAAVQAGTVEACDGGGHGGPLEWRLIQK